MIYLIHGFNRIPYYLKAIKKIVSQKKQVIFLVPETNLISDIRYRILDNLKIKQSEIALLHSQLKTKEYCQEWKKIKNQNIPLIIGTRTALFAPIKNLGLIIIDKIENFSYKSPQEPRYQAQAVALKLAQLTNAKVIFGSTTPPVGLYYWAKKGKYQLISLKEKISSGRVTIIDLKKEIKQENLSVFSQLLQEKIKEIIQKKQKAILFVNRKGLASCVLCQDCGYIVKCPYCEVPLVYHLKEEISTKYKFICHHCGYQESPPELCPTCQSHRIQYFGLGTQRVKKEIKKLFPQITIFQLDSDIVKTFKKQKEIFQKFLQTHSSILVGTQLITKFFQYYDLNYSSKNGLSKIDLIGIVSTTPFLNLPDFRTGEKAFQTLYQLKLWSKNLIIQTYHPENYILQGIANGCYEDFYRNEIKIRKQLLYPPFVKLIKLSYQHKNFSKTKKEAVELFEKLNQAILKHSFFKDNVYLLGPAPAFLPKVRNLFRWQILIKIKEKNFQPIWNELLKIVPPDWKVDVDPLETM